jgi:energy-coupling factor transporter ATP-binding protein EcfA2
MLQRMTVTNFTVFPTADLRFGRNLNLFIGENGTGKTHLLKLAYSMLAISAEEGRKKKKSAETPTKTFFQTRLAEKLINVFRPETLGRLARRKQGRERCDIGLEFSNKNLDVVFNFATNSKSEVSVDRLPTEWADVLPAYLPTRELLTIYPNFIAIYEGHYLEFEETWRDTCLLLGALLQKGPKEKRIKKLLEPLEEAMGGAIELDKSGRFYLNNASGRMEMPLVAEGLRKLGMLARLIATGALLDNGYLFWDEPEANLNPRLIKGVAKCILDLSAAGLQVFIATHSLFLLREMEMLLSGTTGKDIEVRFFGLHGSADGVMVEQGPSVDDAGDIAVLDEELAQSERFLTDFDADGRDGVRVPRP